MNNFFQKRKKQILVGVIGLALTLLLVNLWNFSRQGYFKKETTDPFVVETCLFRHPLRGTCLQENSFENNLPPVYAVMVENSSDAWPQAGLEKAFLVFEIPTEASIPRLLAFYDGAEETVEKIGPVRSARPYFIDFASMFGTLYAHVGGSPEALFELKTTDAVLNFDEYFHQYQFWRDSNRFAPHNVYTATDLLAQGLKRVFPNKIFWEYQQYSFKDDEPITDILEVKKSIIDFGASAYRVEWKYDPESNLYYRWQNSNEHTMEDGQKIVANNVMILEMPMQILDGIGRISVETVGEGKGFILQDGYAKTGFWKRGSDTGLIRLFDLAENEYTLNAGTTWVEIIPKLEDASIF